METSRRYALAALAVLVAFAAGCSGGQKSEPAGEPDKSNDTLSQAIPSTPVKLKLQPVGEAYLSKEDFQLLIALPLQKKYPNITVEYIVPGKGTTISDLVAAKDVPDLLVYGIGNYAMYRDLGILTDITPLLKGQGVDLSRFKPWTLDNIKEEGKLGSLPYATNTNAIYYNLDLFDKFGVEYPKSGMTWDEIVEVAKKLTRFEDGVQYKGYEYFNNWWLGYQLSQPFTNPEKTKAAIHTEGWSRAFQMMKALDDIPGNKFESPSSDFLDKRVLAMIGAVNLIPMLKQEKYDTLRWDIAGYPSFKEKPNTAPPVDIHQIAISSTSKHPEAAMRVIDMFTSEEVQRTSTRSTGRATPLASKQIEQELGADLKLVKGKNVQAFFETNPAPNIVIANEDNAVISSINKFYKEYQSGSVDINVLLRKIEEDANQAISAIKNK